MSLPTAPSFDLDHTRPWEWELTMSLPKWIKPRGDEDKKLRKEREKFESYQVRYGNGLVRAPVELLMRLDSDTIDRLPPETLEKLPIQRLKHLSVDALAKLSPETLSQLPAEEICRLPPETLGKLPPDALAKLTPGFLSKLPPEKLGRVLPELSAEILATMPLAAIAKVTPRELAKVPPNGLAILTNRSPDLLLVFRDLPHTQLLRLPHFVLSKLPTEAFRNISSDVWSDIPEDVWLNIPPDVRKMLHASEEVSEDQGGQNERPPPRTAPSTDNLFRPDSPSAPQYPLNISQDGNLPPRAVVPPPVPRRGGPPLTQRNMDMIPKRNNSLSISRSRASSPTHKYRAPGPRYVEGSPPPERRDSRGTRDGADDWELRDSSLRDRPPPPLPEGIQRKEVGEGFKDQMLTQLNNEIRAKNTMIETLTKERDDKERWSAKMEAERDAANRQVIELEVEKGRLAARMFDCLEGVAPNRSWDRTKEDAAQVIMNYLRALHDNANKNYGVSAELRQQLQREKDNNSYLETQLDTATSECRRAKDDLSTLEYELAERNRELLSKDAQESTFKMKEGALVRERDGLLTKVQELSERLDKEREVAKANLASQHTFLESQAKGIKTHNANLQRELQEQKNKYGLEFQKQHDYYEEQRKNLQAQVELLTNGIKEEVDKVKSQYEEDKKGLRLAFDEQLQKTRSHYEEQIKKERQAHELALKNNSVHLQEKIKSLQSDLVDNSDDFRPATDDSLKTSYGKLKLMVDSITETFNLGVVALPEDGRLDPHKFIAREGKGQMRVLLRSIVWAKIIDGFFSSPFGFGSFGPGTGKTLLVGVYSAWRGLFDGGYSAVSGDYIPEEAFELFRTDREANKWRSATFQSILMAVNPKGAKKAQATTATNGELVRPYAENRQKVHDDILGVLKQVCNNQVQPEIAEVVVEIVQLAGELSLEFGAQRAELALDVPERGDSITIGPEFVDCEDGESARGKLEEVELLVLPKLFRIGDGRHDLRTRKIIVPGEIYPRRSQ